MRRSNTPTKHKQGQKQSASVLALMTNYSTHEVSTRNEKANDLDDKMISKNVDGKQMIKLDPTINFLPLGGWKEFPNNHIPNRTFHISTAFGTVSLCISCSSGADYFSLQCTGVTAVKVKFRDDTVVNDKSISQSITNNKRRFSRTARSHVEEISIPTQHKTIGGDPAEESLQEINFRSPWPCCESEVSFNGVDGMFIAVLGVVVHGESLPSGLSTPIDVLKR